MLDTGHRETSVDIVGLTPGAAYYVQVRAVAGAGTGDWSELTYVRTASPSPTPTPTAIPTPTPTPTPTPIPTPTPAPTPTPSYPEPHVELAESGIEFTERFTAPFWYSKPKPEDNPTHVGIFGSVDGAYYYISAGVGNALTSLSVISNSYPDPYSQQDHEDALVDVMVAIGYTAEQARSIANPHISRAVTSPHKLHTCQTPSLLNLYTSMEDGAWTTLLIAVSDGEWSVESPCEAPTLASTPVPAPDGS